MPVYIISAGDSGAVKIGWTEGNAEERLAALQTANFESLRILRVIPGSVGIETKLHRFFALHRIRGEWFTFVDDINSNFL